VRPRESHSDAMHDYKVHTVATAPAASVPALETLHKALGLLPNLAGTMAESPVLIDAFVGAIMTFNHGTFGGAERQLILLTSAVGNRNAWAVAFHSTLALREGVAAAEVEAVRAGGLPSDARRAAIVATARALVQERGAISAAQREAFVAGGFTPAQLLEVIAGLGASLMANYAGNITDPPLEEAFRAQAVSGSR
jgi:alkylhydroperoxidase family enzyme